MSLLYKTVLILSVICLIIIYYLFDPGELIIFPKCIFYSVTGWYCPGCGSQRAIHHLLHLNIKGVVDDNMLIIPGFLIIGYHYSHQALNRRYKLQLPNILYYKKTPWLIFIILIAYWVIRNINIFPFKHFIPL